MKSRGLLLWVGISFAVPVVASVGCIAEQDAYPNGQPRPPGGIGLPGDTGGEASCGDNNVGAGESCDDGNLANSDGCSSTCQVEACWSCSNGKCVPLAPNTPCTMSTKVCDGKGGCGDCVPVESACDKCKNCGGSTCDEAADCASTACVTGICRSANGSACADPVECAFNHCAGAGALAICAGCTDGAQCASGSCDLTTGTCNVATGEPCDASMTCAANLQCSPINLCQGVAGIKCTAGTQCASNFCGLNQCLNCMEGQACTQGSICSSGACRPIDLPNGAYCVNAADCFSKTCAGFPRKCVPF